MSFTHLHVHSHYSILDGMSKVPDLVDKCIRTGMPAIALTDHGNMYGIKELLDYCKKINKEGVKVKPIVGVEAYCARRSRKSRNKNDRYTTPAGKQLIIDNSGWHLILLSKNIQGYHSLCKIVSESYMDDCFYGKPRIDKELLAQYHEGLIVCSACLGGELPQKIMQAISKTPNALSKVEESIETGVFAEAEETIKWFKDLFGEDYYIELQRHQTDKVRGNQSTYQHQKEVNAVLVALAKKYGIKTVATNDVHFVEEDHADAHELLVCLNTGKTLEEQIQKAENGDGEMAYTKQEWLKTPEEMSAIFSDIPEALENTQEIVDKVEIYNIDSGPIMPEFDIPKEFGTVESYKSKYTEEELYKEFTTDEHGQNPMSEKDAQARIKNLGGYEHIYRVKLEADYLAYLTWEGAKVRYPELVPYLTDTKHSDYHYWDSQELPAHIKEAVDRILFELHIMKTMGFPGYFLIVMDFIRAAREELNVSVGPGRGSAAGSVVAYCLHITDLDPLKYDLLFERFLNPDRVSLPDIDTDFDDAGRGKVLDWVSNKYGRTHVAHIITYGTMAAKSAIADVGRVKKIPLARVNEIKTYIPDKAFPDNIKDEKGKSPKVNLVNCYKYVDELHRLLNGDEPEIRSMLNYAAQLEDTIRQVGIHACGVIIGADDLTNFAPLSSVEDKELGKRVLVTEYDGHVVESVGLIKMDFLGLKTLTIIKECLATIKKVHGEEIDIDHISITDEDTYKLFQEGRTIAVFQFESPGMQKYLKELQPTVIGDLIAMNALYRPGPIAYIPQFIRRKRGEEPVSYDLPEMADILKDTYGVTVYQEQVMLLSRKLANFTRGESDKLRKAMGKKQMAILQELKGKFLEGGKANGHDEHILEKIWTDWEAFASYAFNKSHAACYSWLAYQTGYLKAHYPAEFMAANLTTVKDDIKEVTKFMDECKAMKIGVLEPDVNESELNFTVNKAGNIRFGLGGIKGVGEAAVEAIINEREQNGKFKDIYDFLERVSLQACNKKTIEALALAGAFDCFEGIYREQLVAQTAKGESMLDVLIRYGNTYQQDKQQQQNSLFGDLMADGAVYIQKPELPTVPRLSAIERLNTEKNLIGIFLSAHPLDEYEFEITDLSTITTADLLWLDQHRKETEVKSKDGRTIRKRRLCLKDWEGAAAEMPDTESNTGENTAEEGIEAEEGNNTESKPVNVYDKLKSLIERYQSKPFHIGGIITAAEEKVSQRGTPYGVYTIEDYHSSYQFTLFSESYQQCAPMLKPNLYVYLTGALQQQGKGQRWFKEKAIEEAEWEVQIQKVEMLQEVQDKHVEALTIKIPLENVQPELTTELLSQFESHKGKVKVKIQIYDELKKNVITFMSGSYAIHIDKEFYHWLKMQEAEERLSHKISEMA